MPTQNKEPEYEVTRFEIVEYSFSEPSYEMTENDTGDYVLYESYAELKNKHDELLRRHNELLTENGWKPLDE